MKSLSLFIVLFGCLILNAQPNTELLIFNSSGQNVLTRGDTSITNLMGEIFLNKDILTISDGNITIINRHNKRININEPGKYNFGGISARMQLVESSLSNRYFVFVWEQMNKKYDKKTVSGGVIRGDELLTKPSDSVIVLSDIITFYIKNESDVDYTLLIKSEDFKLLKQDTFHDNITINLSDINNGEHGKYYWEIKIPYMKGPDKRRFFIPENKTKNKMLTDYRNAILDFSSFDEEVRGLLIEEYLRYYKIYI